MYDRLFVNAIAIVKIISIGYFNGVIGVLYYLMIQILGISEIAGEYAQMGVAMSAIMLILGNITFFLLDRLLEKKWIKK